MFRITDTVKHLIIINVIVFIGTKTIGNGMLFYDWFAMHFPKHDGFRPWQIITHMFIHGNEMHLLFNMLLLFFWGPVLESVLGKKRFIFLYISAGLGAVLLHTGDHFIRYLIMESKALEMGFNSQQAIEVFKDGKMFIDLPRFSEIYHTLSFGASGALMGVMASCAFLFPNSEVVLLFPPIPIKMKYLVVGMVGGDFLAGLLTGTPLLASSSIGYFAHVGGALTGVLMVWYWKKKGIN